ncbi:hypothetical protein CHS0354_007745 [Potamilus streckersoni]|uniref:Uncharacterized protein n=1 Tax=Potamilus streckersoni TaxID=2493646 RepID=A0AAE0VIU8_9BIVA|nr:hypothetical protein CHS0354_007745 [Potamilus streckersoni]
MKTAAFIGSKPGNGFEKDTKINASVENEEMFPPTLVKKWNRTIENMHKTIKSHQQVVTELQVVQGAEAELRKDIEKRLELEIQKGLANQIKICQPKQISEIDCSKVARDIFEFTSNVYAIKLPPSSGCFKKSTPPPKMLIPCEEKSEFALSYGSGHQSAARRRNLGSLENIYVTCVTPTKTGSIGHLNIREGRQYAMRFYLCK